MLEPAQVAFEKLAEVGDVVFQHRHPLDAGTEGEARIFGLGSTPTFSSTFGWTMPQAHYLQPFAVLAPGDIHFGGWFGGMGKSLGGSACYGRRRIV